MMKGKSVRNFTVAYRITLLLVTVLLGGCASPGENSYKPLLELRISVDKTIVSPGEKVGVVAYLVNRSARKYDLKGFDQVNFVIDPVIPSHLRKEPFQLWGWVGCWPPGYNAPLAWHAAFGRIAPHGSIKLNTGNFSLLPAFKDENGESIHCYGSKLYLPPGGYVMQAVLLIGRYTKPTVSLVETCDRIITRKSNDDPKIWSYGQLHSNRIAITVR